MGFSAQCRDYFVETFCRDALESGVGLAPLAHAVDDFDAGVELVHHLLDHIDVILQIGVNPDQRVAIGAEESGDKRVQLSRGCVTA